MDVILKYFPWIDAVQRERFAAMYELYLYWNSRINVISRKDIDALYERHVLHSLAICRVGAIGDGQSVLDVGTGGGFPGIPLAVMMPSCEFTLVDSIGKKIHVVEEVAKSLGLHNVRAVNGRVESLPLAADWVVSRAVTDLGTILGWTRNKARCGVLYLKGGDLTAEIKAAGRPAEVMELADWFDEEFFETKKLVLLRK